MKEETTTMGEKEGMRISSRSCRLLITGASGKLGAILFAHLQDDSRYTVSGIDMADDRRADLAQYAPAWVDRLADVDSVIHLAGAASPYCSWASAMRNNVDATLNLIRAAQEQGVTRFILASSLWVMEGYRDVAGPITETMEARPINAYGASKLMCEHIAANAAEAFGDGVSSLRIGWVAESMGYSIDKVRNADPWSRQRFLWLSDFLQAIDRLLTSRVTGSQVVTLVSPGAACRWDTTGAQRALGYQPSPVPW